MAAPTIASRATTSVTSNQASITLNMPSGVASGDLLVAIVATDGDVNGLTTSGDVGTIWYGVAVGQTQAGTTLICYVRRSDGSEGTTERLDISGTEQMAGVVYRITGYLAGDTVNHPVPLPLFASFGNANAAPLPEPVSTPSSSPATVWDYLVLVAVATDDDDDTTPWGPSGYTEEDLVKSNTGANTCMLLVASTTLDAFSGTETPGSMALAASEEWEEATLLIPGELVTNGLQSYWHGITSTYEVINGDGGLNEGVGIEFRAQTNDEANGVWLALSKEGTPTDDVTAELVSTLTGSILASGSIAASTVNATTPGWAYVAFGTPYALTAAGTYYVRVGRSGSRDLTNRCRAHRHPVSYTNSFSGMLPQGPWIENSGSWTEGSATSGPYGHVITSQTPAAGKAPYPGLTAYYQRNLLVRL